MFKIRIVTPFGLYLEDEVEILNIVTPNGQMGILANHIPIVAALEISIMTTDGSARNSYSVGGGMMQFQNNIAFLLLNSIESKEEIDIERAYRARERAIKRLNSNNQSIDLSRSEKALKRANTRIKMMETVR